MSSTQNDADSALGHPCGRQSLGASLCALTTKGTRLIPGVHGHIEDEGRPHCFLTPLGLRSASGSLLSYRPLTRIRAGS